MLAEHGAKSNFLGYGGFPATICTSVNEVVVHGIPDRETVLKDGDIISIDAGAIIDGWHGDAAYTAFVGDRSRPGAASSSAGSPRSRCGPGIAAVARATGWSTSPRRSRATSAASRVRPPASTGSSRTTAATASAPQMHMDPHLLNYVDRKRGRGPKLVPGFCLAIEPMVTLGTAEDRMSSTTTGRSRRTTAPGPRHWEHSVALTEEGPLVLTAPDGGKAKLAELGITAAPDPLA